MRTLRILTAVTLLSVVAGAARADGLLYQLPKDGDWVVFDYQITGERGGMKYTSKGTLYIGSVGRTTEGNDECRWIEFTNESTHSDGTGVMWTDKVLIPEKYLKKGEYPLEHIIRGWWKLDDSEVREIQEGGSAEIEAWNIRSKVSFT